MLFVTPLIHHSERFEGGKFHDYNKQQSLVNKDSERPGQSDYHSEHSHNKTSEESNNLERILLTLATNILVSVGFSFLLCGTFLFLKDITLFKSIGFGAIGYLIFLVLPSLGLEPKLPGMESAPIGARQTWWVLTVISSTIGISLIIGNYKKIVYITLGILLIALPHIIGAPLPDRYGGSAPKEIFQQFLIAVIISNLIYWLFLGGFTGHLFKRFQKSYS